MAVIDHFGPLHPLARVALSDHGDLVLDEVWPEVDRDVIRRSKSADELLTVDDDRDSRPVKTRADRQVDDAFDLAVGLRIAAQHELRSARLRGAGEDAGDACCDD